MAFHALSQVQVVPLVTSKGVILTQRGVRNMRLKRGCVVNPSSISEKVAESMRVTRETEDLMETCLSPEEADMFGLFVKRIGVAEIASSTGKTEDGVRGIIIRAISNMRKEKSARRS